MTLPVANQYTIEIGSITQAHFDWLSARKYAGWIVFADENTVELCLPLIEEYLPEDTPVIVAPEGELNKNLETCQELWEDMFTAGVGRRWCAICLGGGVLEDMAGFVASIGLRASILMPDASRLTAQHDPGLDREPAR